MKTEKIKTELFVLVKKIPKGKITTYGLLAKKLKVHPRVVGKLLNSNQDPKVPCYKVIKSNSLIGGYRKGKKLKKELLKKEGIKIKKDKILNFKKILFKF